MEIKAILFDFYGVICSDDLWDFTAVDRQSQSEIHELSDQVNLGALSWEEFCKRLAVASDRRVEEINAMYQQYQINRPLIGYVGELKKRFKIGMLTNANHGHIDGILHEIGARDDFDAITVSADIGMIKPMPGIYKAAARDLGVEVEECVFTDDAIRNVEGAQAVGMQAILFENAAQFRKELELLIQG